MATFAVFGVHFLLHQWLEADVWEIPVYVLVPAQFVTRVRKNEAIYGADSVALDCHRVSTLAFSKHKSPIPCSIYNKTLTMQSLLPGS